MIRTFYRGLLGKLPSGKQWLRVLLRALVSLTIISVLLWWLPTDQLWHSFRIIPNYIWLMVFAGYLLGHVLSALKWRMLLRAVQINVGKMDAIRAHGAGLFANLCLPSVIGGDFVRASVIIRRYGNLEHIALGALTDRLNDTIALVVIAAVAGLLLPEQHSAVPAHWLSVFAVLLLLAVISGVAVLLWCPQRLLPKMLSGLLNKFRVALRSLLAAPHIALLTLLFSVLIQSLFIMLNVAIAQAIGISASIYLWFFAWPLAKLIALAPISLGGIGIREAALGALLVPFGFEAAQIVAQGLSWQVVLIVSGVFSGIAVTWLPGDRPVEGPTQVAKAGE